MLDGGDPYFHLADLPAYLDAQRRVDDAFRQPAVWASKAILNVARIGGFSSDRTIKEYASDVWGIASVDQRS
jgi:starch phosphorylase